MLLLLKQGICINIRNTKLREFFSPFVLLAVAWSGSGRFHCSFNGGSRKPKMTSLQQGFPPLCLLLTELHYFRWSFCLQVSCQLQGCSHNASRTRAQGPVLLSQKCHFDAGFLSTRESWSSCSRSNRGLWRWWGDWSISFKRKGCGSWACSTSRRGRGDLINVCHYLKGSVKMIEPGSTQWCHAIGQ